jgi:hypothetical protein
MAEGGGTGLTTMPVLQSLSQARDKWGENAANAIWDAAIVKVILGGSCSTKDLTDFKPYRGTRRIYRHPHPRRAGRPHPATRRPQGRNHAAAGDPHAAVRDQPDPATRRAAHHRGPAHLDH